MRNLKRALSLALASIMLLGMMVTGASAASNSFTDFDQIVNQEAAEVTSGLGIFDGYTDGSFGPENVVTRAEMAVIICKLLNGSDVDPGNFTDIDTFDDVPAWAEGYVNYCASMGIVVGVGERKFNPSATVSTVEAATMLLKALGYFIEEDQLGADWKTVVTGRATSLKLYGALTLGVDEGLTRDNVAELLFHTLFAQRVAYDDNRHLYVKNTNRDVVVTNGTNDPENTLAKNTFGMWYIDGVVTANSYTDDSLSETVNNLPRTNVLFDAEQDLPYMGGASVKEYPFEYTTNLDMIAHAARVYYSMERNAPVVYAIVDRATKVEYVTYDTNNANLSDAANALGFRRNTIAGINENDYIVNYDWDITVSDLPNNSTKTNGVTLNPTDQPWKTLVVISNSSDCKVDYVIALDQYLDRVNRVSTVNDKTVYTLLTRNGAEQNIALDEAAAEDYVVVTDIGKQGDMFVFYKPELLDANISKITSISNSNATVKAITADGTEYKGSPVADSYNNTALTDTTDFESIDAIGDATLILDFQGKCIGLAKAAGNTLYAYVAQYAVEHVSGFGTKDVLVAELYFSDGTKAVHRVNTDLNRNGNVFYGYDAASYAQNDLAKLNRAGGYADGSRNVYDPTGFKVSGKQLVFPGTSNGLGVFKVSVRGDNTVILSKPGDTEQSSRVDAALGRIVQKHSTLIATQNAGTAGTPGYMAKNGNVTMNTTGTTYEPMYQNGKTVYFYVDGTWDDDLTVGVLTGVENAKNVTHDKDNDENGTADEIVQLWESPEVVANNVTRHNVKAAMIFGYDLGLSTDLYFYNRGNCDREALASSRAETKYQITYHAYTADGEPKDIVYDNNGAGYDAVQVNEMAANKNTGFYTIGSKDLDEKITLDDTAQVGPNGVAKEVGKYTFVLNAAVSHTDYVSNLYTYNEVVGGIVDGSNIVDTTGNGIETISDIADKCAANHTVRISYYYTTSGTGEYVVKTVFVSGYEQRPLDGGNNLAGNKTITNGNVSLTAPNYAAPISAYASGAWGTGVAYNFSTPSGMASTATVSYDIQAKVNGTVVFNSTVTATTSNGMTGNMIYGTVPYMALGQNDKVDITISNVKASAYIIEEGTGVDVTAIGSTPVTGNTVPTLNSDPDGVTSATDAIKFTVDVDAADNTQVSVHYTITGVVNGTETTYVGDATGLTVRSKKTAEITVPVAMYAAGLTSGSVKITASVSGTSQETLTFAVNGDDGFAVGNLSIAPAKTIVSTTAPEDLGILTITKPANVDSFNYVITVSGVKPNFSAISGSCATGDATVVVPLGTYTATGPVVVTLTTSGTVYKGTIDALTDDDSISPDSMTFGTYDAVTGSVEYKVNADKTLSGIVTANKSGNFGTGSYTLTVEGDAKMQGDSKTVTLDAAGSTLNFGNVVLTDVTGDFNFKLAYTATYDVTLGNGIKAFTTADGNTEATITGLSGTADLWLDFSDVTAYVDIAGTKYDSTSGRLNVKPTTATAYGADLYYKVTVTSAVTGDTSKMPTDASSDAVTVQATATPATDYKKAGETVSVTIAFVGTPANNSTGETTITATVNGDATSNLSSGSTLVANGSQALAVSSDTITVDANPTSKDITVSYALS